MEDMSVIKPVLRVIVALATFIYLALLAIILLEISRSLLTQSPLPGLELEIAWLLIFLSISLVSSLILAAKSRKRPSAHHARKILGEHVAHLSDEELYHHLKYHR